MTDPVDRFSQLLAAANAGDPSAHSEAMVLIYDELRGLARRRLANSPINSIQTTDLVNETYLRLAGKDRLDFQNRPHFFALAARAMRDILVERARSNGATKRGGQMRRVDFNSAIVASNHHPEEFLMLDDAISRLSKQDKQAARIVMLRFFVGLTGDETAEALGISPSTVDRRWQFARAWLHEALYGKQRD